ncbi:MAG: hypothetical protein KC516_04470 [Nanoarchaeota archaeon]|nr:hypothetical protein [Nanoarchaeota archaeon]
MKISKDKREKIMEQILALLYSKNPLPLFISQISYEIARDEEFVKKLLLEMAKKGLVIQIKQNPKGIFYIRRSRWKLTPKTYDLYKSSQI